MTAPEPPLPGELARRIEQRWTEEAWTASGDRVVAAVSGGLDSLVLLHLLRFPLETLGLEVVVAHFDHAMRPGSAADAAWVRGVAGAWGLAFRLERAQRTPASEAEARAVRYAFLRGVMEREGARRILTAHHADDRAETVVYHLVRGTGVRGLAGIPRTRESWGLRPLLDEPRSALEAYAEAVGLRPLLDPTNLETRWARNRIRLQVLPAMEAVHPGAREGILRTARNARRAAEALDALLEPVLNEVIVHRGRHSITLDRDRLLAHGRPVQGLVVRGVTREAGIHLDEAGTVGALEFIRTGSSGGRRHLPGRALLSRDFGRIHLRWGHPGDREEGEAEEEPDAPLVVSALEPPGEGTARLAGRPVRVAWSGRSPPEGDEAVWTAFDPDDLALPLTVRRWQPGDRTRGPGGSRKLKKVFGELEISVERRSRIPAVQDGRGEVIWVPGVFRAWTARPGAATRTWYLGIQDDDQDT